jgi:hypothetical protein
MTISPSSVRPITQLDDFRSALSIGSALAENPAEGS